ncbi:hypothetical protein HDU86_000648 [Geranomyces michiganensis]|nr:hypothetical protein HDU86_000648 [Geranomyces michiganensis]
MPAATAVASDPYPTVAERRVMLQAAGLNVERISDDALKLVAEDFEVAPLHTISKSIQALLRPQLEQLEVQMREADTDDWPRLMLESALWTTTFQVCLLESLFVFSGSITSLVVNVAYRLWLMKDEEANMDRSFLRKMRRTTRSDGEWSSVGRGGRVARPIRAPTSGPIGTTLGLRSRVDSWEGQSVELVTVNNMDEFARVRDEVNATQFHGTSLEHAPFVAARVDIKRGRRGSEFSRERGFFTFPSEAAAISRSYELFLNEPKAIVLFGPITDTSLSHFRFDFEEKSNVELWRKLVWHCCNDPSYTFEHSLREDLMSAHIVTGPICIKAVANHLSGLEAYQADQTGYLTQKAVDAVQAASTRVVVCLSEDFVRPAKLLRYRQI